LSVAVISQRGGQPAAHGRQQAVAGVVSKLTPGPVGGITEARPALQVGARWWCGAL
jgi:hypothetical protein